MKFFNSNKVKAFPTAFRSINVDPKSIQLTEKNLIRAGGYLNAANIEGLSYVIQYPNNTDSKLYCMLGGYYFEIDCTGENLNGLYLAITLNSDNILVVFEGNTPSALDVEGEFKGIACLTAAERATKKSACSAWLQPFDAEGNINNECLLPRVKSGSGESAVVLGSIPADQASGHNAVVAGGNTTASGDYAFAAGFNTKATEDYQTVVGKYNKEEAGEFIVGTGAAANKKNALVVNGNDVTVRDNLYVKNNNDTVLKATKTETVIDSNKAKILATETAEIIAADKANIVSGAIELSTPLDENEKQEKVSISNGKIDIVTKNGKHLTIDDANDNIKLCLHKDANGRSRGKLILDLDSNNKTRAELDAETITLKGNTKATGPVDVAGKLTVGDANNTPGAIINGDTTVKGKLDTTNKLTIGSQTNKPGADIYGDTTVNGALSATNDLTAKSGILLGSDKNNHAKLTYNKDTGKINLTLKDNIEAPVAPQISIQEATSKSTGIMLGETDLAQKVKELIQYDIRKDAFNEMFPIGSIYVSYTTNNGNCPVALYNSTWERITDTFLYAAIDNNATFGPAKTGGSKDAIVVAHTHDGTTESGGNHAHSYTDLYPDLSANKHRYTAQDNNGGWYVDAEDTYKTNNTKENGSHSHSFTTNSTGEDGTNKNMPPYLCVYMWRRIA